MIEWLKGWSDCQNSWQPIFIFFFQSINQVIVAALLLTQILTLTWPPVPCPCRWAMRRSWRPCVLRSLPSTIQEKALTPPADPAALLPMSPWRGRRWSSVRVVAASLSGTANLSSSILSKCSYLRVVWRIFIHCAIVCKAGRIRTCMRGRCGASVWGSCRTLSVWQRCVRGSAQSFPCSCSPCSSPWRWSCAPAACLTSTWSSSR